MKNISSQLVFEAYRKFKSNYYYDKSSLAIRLQIAEFEENVRNAVGSDFREKFDAYTVDLLNALNGQEDVETCIASYCAQIDCTLVPKNMERTDDKNDNIQFLSNVEPIDSITVKDVNVVIVAPIEIHILSTLWVMLIGIKLSKCIGDDNYAYLLEYKDADRKEIKPGLKLYKPYFYGYQQWRDNAHHTAKLLLQEHKNASIVSLDIQRYYYSVRVNLPLLYERIKADYHLSPNVDERLCNRLNDIMQAIHKKYAEVVSQYVPQSLCNIEGEEFPLPVGLLSSGLLANLYLADFDKKVREKLSPIYYGRYVDDMLFVMANTSLKDTTDANKFIDDLFCKKGELLQSYTEKNTDKEEDTTEESYFLIDHPNLKIQKEKLLVLHFDHHGSQATLDKFMRNIKRQRSEFRFLPNEDIVERNFEDAALTIQYQGSLNKLRSIQDLKEDKYEASTYLSQLILLSCHWDKGEKNKRLQQAQEQILSFFKGRLAIEFYALWEKVTTFFVLNGREKALTAFHNNVTKAIGKINHSDGDACVKLKKDLTNYLHIAEAMPKAMDEQVVPATSEVAIVSLLLRQAHLFRRELMMYSFLDLIKKFKDPSFDLLHTSLSELTEEELALDDESAYVMPTFVHFEALNLLNIYKNIEDGAEILPNSVIKQSKEDFWKVNHKWHDTKSAADCIGVVCDYVANKEGLRVQKRYIRIKETADSSDKLRAARKIAIANMKVDTSSLYNMIIGKTVCNPSITTQLQEIINEAHRHRCDLLIFPELSVPHEWLTTLCMQCIRCNMGIVAGLGYTCNSHKEAFNMVATILPVKIGNYTTCMVSTRVKNHYAPSEKKILEGYGFTIPKQPAVYDHFHWRQLYFTVYNCFELASIEARALFKSEIDLIIATECNKDTHYYSDIIGSWVRDIHCYLAQINTSEYGDSRIMRPSKSESRDLVIVKGGKNSTVLIEELEVSALRNFQLKGHPLQLDDKSFKPTPPEFDVDKVLKRIKDEEVYDK